MSDISTYSVRFPARGNAHRLRDVDYYINEWGDPDAPLIVFLHGWGDSGATFQFVVDALAGRWHVIAPDWRGFGKTIHRARGYWFPDYLADLDRLLEIYSPSAPVRLVGHSMGGNIGGLYAGAMPERVSAFINVEGFGLPDTSAEEAPALSPEPIFDFGPGFGSPRRRCRDVPSRIGQISHLDSSDDESSGYRGKWPTGA